MLFILFYFIDFRFFYFVKSPWLSLIPGALQSPTSARVPPWRRNLGGHLPSAGPCHAHQPAMPRNAESTRSLADR